MPKRNWFHGVTAPECPICETPLTSVLNVKRELRLDSLFLCIHCLSWLTAQGQDLRLARPEELKPVDAHMTVAMQLVEQRAKAFRYHTFH